MNCRHCNKPIVPCVRCQVIGTDNEDYIGDWCHDGSLGYHHCGPDGIKAEPAE